MTTPFPPSTRAPLHPSSPAPPLPGSPAPTLRPSLEYHYAFDLCAMEAQHQGGPVAVFASSAFYANELLERLQGCETRLFPSTDWSSCGADAPDWLGAATDGSAADLHLLSSLAPQHPSPSAPPLPGSPAHAAIWAEPEWEDGQRTLQEIAQALAPGGRLYVIVSGWLARFLPEWRRAGPLPAVRRAGGWRTQQWLRQVGLATEALYGFQVPLSLLWGYTSLGLERLGRKDWADRCHFRMRVEYVARGGMALVAPVGVVVARKVG